MKIALVVPGGFERPGAPAPPRSIPALHALVARLAREHEVHVYCTDFDELGGTWPFAGATVHDHGRVRSSAWPGRRTAVRAWRLGAALRRDSRARAFDVVHAFWVDGNGIAAALAARALGVAFVASVGGGECAALHDIAYGNGRTAKGRLTTRAILAAAEVVTVGSRAAMLSVPRPDVAIVPLGAEPDLFFAPAIRPPGPPFRIIHVASHNAVKDPWTLLEALRGVVAAGLDVELTSFGEDTLRGAVLERARALGLEGRIDLRGRRSSAEVALGLRSAHVNVVSSRHESQCVAVLEAALAGVPTVGTSVGLVADLAPLAAIAVPVQDAAALAEAVRASLLDPARRASLAAAAQRYAALHDAAWTTATFVSLYERARTTRGDNASQSV